MKKIYCLLCLVILVLPLAAGAASKHPPAPVQTSQAQGETIHVGVDGMVCDFCAQSLKKVFLKNGAVKNVDISLEKKQVTIGLKPGKTLSDAEIKKEIDFAGYDLTTIHRIKL